MRVMLRACGRPVLRSIPAGIPQHNDMTIMRSPESEQCCPGTGPLARLRHWLARAVPRSAGVIGNVTHIINGAVVDGYRLAKLKRKGSA